MTRNQIDYWSLQETKANNLRNWNETVRSNKAREYETNRHNLATEDLGNRNLMEITRHNRATEYVEQGKLAETRRSNLAREAETNRSNMAQEAISRDSNKYKREALAETKRSNVANEQIRQATNYLGQTQLRETVRTNKANEKLRNREYYETMRRNSQNLLIAEMNREVNLQNLAYNYASLDQTKVRDSNQQVYRMLDLQERTKTNTRKFGTDLLHNGIDLLKLVTS